MHVLDTKSLSTCVHCGTSFAPHEICPVYEKFRVWLATQPLMTSFERDKALKRFASEHRENQHVHTA